MHRSPPAQQPNDWILVYVAHVAGTEDTFRSPATSACKHAAFSRQRWRQKKDRALTFAAGFNGSRNAVSTVTAFRGELARPGQIVPPKSQIAQELVEHRLQRRFARLGHFIASQLPPRRELTPFQRQITVANHAGTAKVCGMDWYHTFSGAWRSPNERVHGLQKHD